MPELVLDPNGLELLLVWRDSSSGDWNTYATAYSLVTGAFTQAVRVSSSSGYSDAVRSWHGDYLGVSFIGRDRACIAWGDGRGGASPDVGFGHIYAAVLTIHAAASASFL